MECTVLSDTGIVDEQVDWTEFSLDLLDPNGAGIERTDIPFIDGDTSLRFECFRRGIITGIACRDFIASRLQRLADRSTNPRVPPVTNAIRAMSNSSP